MMSYYWPMMGNGWGFSGGLMMLLNFVFFILFIIGIIYLIKYLIFGGGSNMPAKNSALEILKERYAKSEINKQEFEEKKKDLEK